MSDPVLIVGAGPTGMLLAIWLKVLAPDIPFRIIDKAAGPGTTSRAMIVHARTVEIYRQLGLADEMLDEAQILSSAVIRVKGKERGRAIFGALTSKLTKYPYVLAYPQDWHEKLLLRRLEALGVEVQWNTVLTTLVRHDSHVDATFNGKAHRFSYVAGCDGAHSPVRKALSVPMKGGTYPHKFFVADVSVADVTNPRQVNACPSSRAFGLFIPLDESGHVRLFHNVRQSASDEAQTTFENLQPSIESSTGLQIEKVNWMSVYKVHHRIADTFQQGRAFLVGDAAHLHSPVGGQGMNTGLGDATNLAWKIAAVMNGQAGADILDTYAPERMEFAQKLVDTTDRVYTVLTQMTIVGWLFRSFFIPLVVPLLWSVRTFRTFFFTMLSQLGVAYLHSPLSNGKAGKLQAGVRLPWVDFGHKDNYESLTTWQLHVYERYGFESSSSHDWNGFPISRFELTKIAKAAGYEEMTYYFVRPDGYIGLICDVSDEGTLADYVARWKLVPSKMD